MAHERIGRRELIMGGGAGAVALAAVTLPATAAFAKDDHGQRGGLQGSWLVTRQNDGSPDTVLVVVSFAGGNVSIAHDIRPPGPPFLGTWAQRGSNQFRATAWTDSTVPGLPGTVEVHLTGRFDEATMSGTYAGAFFDPNDEELLSFTGIFSGQRIDA